jgi:three-Cys-motif partner protein
MSGSAPRAKNKFGGAWTIEKLSFLKRYLAAYTRIMTSNERARFFKTSYVDAFAGSGTISREYDSNQTSVFNGTDEFIEGSAMVALENYPSFDKYYFIEKSSSRCKGLRELAANYPGIANRVQISEGDANSELSEWIEKTEWRTNRAVVFLDPFGMQVDWNVIEQLALTKAVDLWLLFPLGTGVMRLMTKDKFPGSHLSILRDYSATFAAYTRGELILP